MKTLATIVVAALSFLSLAFSTPVTAGQYIFTTIDNPAGSVNGERTRAFGINDAGQIVGDFGAHGFLYSGGIFTTIDVPGAGVTQAFDINSAGQIVGTFSDSTGTHGFLYSGGIFTTIDVPVAGTANGSATKAFGINNAGQIVGDFTIGSSLYGYLYSGGLFTIINFPGAYFTQAFGINDAGQIVGSMGFRGVG